MPLKISDIELIKNIKTKKDDDSFLELRNRYSKIYYNVCKGYSQKCGQLKYTEIIEDVNFILLDALNTFNEDKKTKFSTWLYCRARYHCLKTLKQINEDGKFIPHENKEIDFLNSSNNRMVDCHKNKELKDYLFDYLDKINDERIKKIFELRYFGDKEDKKWKSIAEQLKMSSTYAKLLHDNTCKNLKKRIKMEDMMVFEKVKNKYG